jgi:hypothetical protein
MSIAAQLRTLLFRLTVLGGFLVGGTILSGCGCGCAGMGVDREVPEWYLNTPEDPNYVYAATTGTSAEMQAAIDTATAGARTDLVRSLDTKLESATQTFADSLDGRMRRSFVEARSEAVRTISAEVPPQEKEVYEEDDTFRAYVLMEVPVYEAAQTLLSTLEEREQLHDRFLSSQFYGKMMDVKEFQEKGIQER